jgi:hypothetical protein
VSGEPNEDESGSKDPMPGELIEDVIGSKNRFQRERPCKNLGEVRRLVYEQDAASASKRNFIIDSHLTAE